MYHKVGTEQILPVPMECASGACTGRTGVLEQPPATGLGVACGGLWETDGEETADIRSDGNGGGV